VVNKAATAVVVVDTVVAAAVSVLISILNMTSSESKADHQIKDILVVEVDMVEANNNKVVVDGIREMLVVISSPPSTRSSVRYSRTRKKSAMVAAKVNVWSV
jgi:hypothetical protein